MSDFYWLEPEWKKTRCACCGNIIWPEGDPDWGMCYDCFSNYLNQRYEPGPVYICDICGKKEAITEVNGFGVCSQQCADESANRKTEGKDD